MAQQASLQHLSAIVIGAGFGGLAAGIELALRGAKVRIFESYPDMTKQGKRQVEARQCVHTFNNTYLL